MPRRRKKVKTKPLPRRPLFEEESSGEDESEGTEDKVMSRRKGRKAAEQTKSDNNSAVSWLSRGCEIVLVVMVLMVLNAFSAVLRRHLKSLFEMGAIQNLAFDFVYQLFILLAATHSLTSFCMSETATIGSSLTDRMRFIWCQRLGLNLPPTQLRVIATVAVFHVTGAIVLYAFCQCYDGITEGSALFVDSATKCTDALTFMPLLSEEPMLAVRALLHTTVFAPLREELVLRGFITLILFKYHAPAKNEKEKEKNEEKQVAISDYKSNSKEATSEKFTEPKAETEAINDDSLTDEHYDRDKKEERSSETHPIEETHRLSDTNVAGDSLDIGSDNDCQCADSHCCSQRRSNDGKALWDIAKLTSAVFAAMHSSNLVNGSHHSTAFVFLQCLLAFMVSAFYCGVLFTSALRRREQTHGGRLRLSLWDAILLHAINNGASMLVVFDTSSPDLMSQQLIIAPLFVTLLFYGGMAYSQYESLVSF